MYLIEIDEETGLISEQPSNSGWKAIKAFRDVYNSKRLGLKGLTVVALTIDYLSIYSHYVEKDRFARACEEIFGKRSALKYDDNLLSSAMKKYAELQFNPDFEHKKINDEIKSRLLNKISLANKAEDDVEIDRLRKSLAAHEKSVIDFDKRFDKREASKTAVTNNGYELSRIENDLISRKNSKFENFGEGFENPNKLGLT